MAIRRSLDPQEILQLAVEKLGEGLDVCRCIIYLCKENDDYATINHEYLKKDAISILGHNWQLKNNPLFEYVIKKKEYLSINNVCRDLNFSLSFAHDESNNILVDLIENCSIVSWLLIPILYQEQLLGMLELHHCQNPAITWKNEDINLVNAIATQLGVTLIQAESYNNLETLNQQLEVLDRTRSNLVAITGHELRTPLSTIQVCLESLSLEPDMPKEMREIMLETALNDAERMRKLVQDFLTLSQLESGTIKWNFEPLSLAECIALSVSNVKARHYEKDIPNIINNISSQIPLVKADGEWLVEVLAKLLDNSCKFTSSKGKITIETKLNNNKKNIEVIILDTGRGIEIKTFRNCF